MGLTSYCHASLARPAGSHEERAAIGGHHQPAWLRGRQRGRNERGKRAGGADRQLQDLAARRVRHVRVARSESARRSSKADGHHGR